MMSPTPLTPTSVSPVLRILLPTLTGLAWLIAYSWATITPRDLDSSAVLRVLDSAPSLRMWAVAVGIGAALMTVALLRHRRALYTYALAVTLGVFLVMAIVSAVAATEGVTSSSAWAWPSLVVAISAACIRGINSREGGS